MTARSNDQSFTHYFNQQLSFPSPSSRTPPPSSDTNRPHLHNFEQINRYSNINRPSITQQKRSMIEQTLQLDKQAKVIATARMKRQNLFVNYDRNPFNEVEGAIKEKQRWAYKDRDGFQSKNIRVDSEAHQRLENKKNFTNIIDAVCEIGRREPIENAGKIRRQVQHFEHLSKRLTQESLAMDHRLKQPLPDEPSRYQSQKEVSFDEIIAMEDENYYVNNQIQINIFQFMKGNHKPFVSSSILDQYYFSHESSVDRAARFKFHHFRDIGRAGRKLIKDVNFTVPARLDYITSNQITFKIGHCLYEDIMSIASGRFSPEIVYKAANQIQIRDEGSGLSEISVDTVAYEDNFNNHRGTNHEGNDIEREQIFQYIRLPNNRTEDKYREKCQYVYTNVSELMEQKTQLTHNTIKDKMLHRDINGQVQRDFDYLVGMDYQKMDTNKRVRNGKVNKNRNEHIKIRTLLKSIELKNREEEKIRWILEDQK